MFRTSSGRLKAWPVLILLLPTIDVQLGLITQATDGTKEYVWLNHRIQILHHIRTLCTYIYIWYIYMTSLFTKQYSIIYKAIISRLISQIPNQVMGHHWKDATAWVSTPVFEVGKLFRLADADFGWSSVSWSMARHHVRHEIPQFDHQFVIETIPKW